MPEEIDLLPFGRFSKTQPYFGSYKGMRYKVAHPKPEEGEENLLYVEVWPEPFCYEKADKDEITKVSFVYSKEGYDQIIPYLAEQYTERFADR